ncbi:MAG: hypothetical protein NXI10_05075 [bacterium]|nr:hypothetical protein [bacterium]
MRTIQLIVFCLLPFVFYAQWDEASIIDYFELQKKKSKMGLIEFESEKVVFPMGKDFIYLSDYSNALLKVKGEDIEVYTFIDNTLRLVHTAQTKTLLSFSSFQDEYARETSTYRIIEIGDSIIDAKDGKKPTYFVPRYYHVDSQLGVEIVGDRLFVQDRLLEGRPGGTPIIDEDPESPNFGENLIVTDSVTGMQSFVYEPPTPPKSSSGIFNRKFFDWEVPTMHYGVIPSYDFGHVIISKNEGDGYPYATYYDAYDKNHDQRAVAFSEDELTENPQLLKYLVPHYNCDSIAPFSEIELEKPFQERFSAVRFYDGPKVGVFDWKGDILMEPQDVHIPVDFISSCSIGINDNQIWLNAPFLSEKQQFKKGDKFHLVVRYARYPHEGFYALNWESTSENIERFFSKAEYKDAVEVDSNLLGEYAFEDLTEFDAHCVIQNLGEDILLVNYLQFNLLGSAPLIDEDPNSPNFGDYLIETDSVTGNEMFVYEYVHRFAQRSGVFDLNSHSWLIPPHYYFVEAIEDSFVTHTANSKWETDVQTTLDREGNVISVEEVEPEWNFED